MNNETQILETGRRYLIEQKWASGRGNIYEISVIEVSENAYKIKYDTADKAHWNLKTDFNYNYKVVETLPYN